MRSLESLVILLIVLLAAFVVVVSVHGCDRQGAKSVFRVEEAKAREGSGRVLIVVDTSSSMRGFFAVSPRAYPVQHFLPTEIIPLLAEHRLSQVYSSTLEDMESPIRARDLRTFAVFRDEDMLARRYGSRDTNLTGAFRHLRDEKAFDVIICLTDNVQDLSVKEENKNMTKGLDPVFFDSLTSLGEAGYTLWLIANQSQFRGRYYPVKSSSDGCYHSFIVDKPDLKRPVYLWIMGRDPDRTTQIAAAIVKILKRVAGAASVAAVPLTVLRLQKRKIAFTAHPHDRKSVLMANLDGVSSHWRVPRGAGTLCVPFHLEGFSDAKELSVLVPRLRPHRDWAFIRNDGQAGWSLCVVRSLLPGVGFFSGSSSRSEAILEVAVVTGEDLPPEKRWWKLWSTEDDRLPENIGKTVYLDRLDPLIENLLKTTGNEGPLSRMNLQISKIE